MKVLCLKSLKSLKSTIKTKHDLYKFYLSLLNYLFIKLGYRSNWRFHFEIQVRELSFSITNFLTANFYLVSFKSPLSFSSPISHIYLWTWSAHLAVYLPMGITLSGRLFKIILVTFSAFFLRMCRAYLNLLLLMPRLYPVLQTPS